MKGNSKIILYTIGGLVLLVLSIWLFEGRRIIAKVGDFKIYKEDVMYRNKLNKLNYPNETAEAGYEQLIRAYTQYQIMRNHHYSKIEERLKTELERMERETQNPAGLKKIKEEVFEGNLSSFKRAFVVPAAVAEEVYFGFFDQNQSIHEPTQKRTEEYFNRLKETKKSFAEFAQENGLIYRKIQISRKHGILPVNLKTNTVDHDFLMDAKMRKPDEELIKFWFGTILKNLKPGDMLSQPINHKESWQIGRLVSQKGKDEKVVELLIVPKESFSDFLEREKKHVSIQTGFFLF